MSFCAQRRSRWPLIARLTPPPQIIHFVRHGEGFHNIGLITLDSHLTEKGWAQAHALGRHMYSTPPCGGVQVRRAGAAAWGLEAS